MIKQLKNFDLASPDDPVRLLDHKPGVDVLGAATIFPPNGAL